MKKIDVLIIALKNIKNSRIKGFLSILSICIGISSISLVSEIGRNASGQIQKELGQISNNATIIQSELTLFNEEDIKTLKNHPNVKGAMPYVFDFGMLYAKNEQTQIGRAHV